MTDPRRVAHDSMREQFRAAARRELPARRRHRWRWRWRGAGLAVVALLGVSVAAGATDLISVGQPLPDHSFSAPRYSPAGDGVAKLVVKAPDPDSGLGWGAGVYISHQGLDCVIAGQVRGVTLGRVRDGSFHPYQRGSTGACGDLSRLRIFFDTLRIEGAQPRTIVYGRARSSAPTISINDDGRRRTVRPGPGGAFLFVVRGTLAPGGLGPAGLDLRVDRG